MELYLDIEVALSGCFPLIWRRFWLRARDTTFADLHRAIACGWQDYHLYQFEEAGPDGLIGLAQSPIEIDEDINPAPAATEVSLAEWIGEHTPRACSYLYDFGDDWHHDVVVRGIVESDERVFRALVGGECAFPPEDCGGMHGFAQILEFRRTGIDPDPDPGVDLGGWLGAWQPEAVARALLQTDPDLIGPIHAAASAYRRALEGCPVELRQLMRRVWDKTAAELGEPWPGS